KQAEAGHDEQSRHKIELLWPDFDKEEIEAPVRHIDQDSLIGGKRPAVPAQPRRHIVNAERDGHDQPFEAAKLPTRTLWKYLLAWRVKRLANARGIYGFGIQPLNINGVGHLQLFQ